MQSDETAWIGCKSNLYNMSDTSEWRLEPYTKLQENSSENDDASIENINFYNTKLFLILYINIFTGLTRHEQYNIKGEVQ